ncbi:MAG: GNAT family N-acetyltransferase [Erysipelotrichaceae bacterium]
MEVQMIYFKEITEDNFKDIINLKRPENENYVASNVYSLAQAWLYRDDHDVYPFAIYDDCTPVGFMMLDEDAENRKIAIWRIMISVEYQCKGYGTIALKEIIKRMRDCKKYDYVTIDYIQGNQIAKHVYQKVGFQETGNIVNGNEVEMQLKLSCDS